MADAAHRLASEREHTTTKGALAALLAIVAVVVLGVNQVAVRTSPARERTYDGLTVAAKWDLASEGAPANGVVVIGDSSGNFAVETSVLEAYLDRPARNYCTYGRFLVTGAAWFLDRAIERAGEPPSLVLVVAGAHTYAMEVNGFTFAQIPTAFGSWSRRAPRVGLSALEAGQFAVSRLFPLYAQHATFGRAIRLGLWTIDPGRLPIGPGGTSVLPGANPDGVRSRTKKVLDDIAALTGPIPSERERAAIRGLVRDAEERGYDVVFVDGPVWSGLAERDEHAEFLARIHTFLDEVCATSERATRLPGGLQTFEVGDMENPFHLVGEAPGRYTRELAARLRALGLPR